MSVSGEFVEVEKRVCPGCTDCRDWIGLWDEVVLGVGMLYGRMLSYDFSQNDEPEQAREDMKHAMVVTLCGGAFHYAPI